MIKLLKAFVEWALKFYWAGVYIWGITFMDVVVKYDTPQGLTVLRDWLIIVVGVVMGIGFLSLWAGGYDFIKK